MSVDRPDYFDRYPTIAFERDAEGILTLRIHSDGGPVVYSPQHDASLADDSSLSEWRYIVTAASDPTVASHAGAARLLRTEPQVCDVVS